MTYFNVKNDGKINYEDTFTNIPKGSKTRANKNAKKLKKLLSITSKTKYHIAHVSSDCMSAVLFKARDCDHTQKIRIIVLFINLINEKIIEMQFDKSEDKKLRKALCDYLNISYRKLIADTKLPELLSDETLPLELTGGKLINQLTGKVYCNLNKLLEGQASSLIIEAATSDINVEEFDVKHKGEKIEYYAMNKQALEDMNPDVIPILSMFAHVGMIYTRSDASGKVRFSYRRYNKETSKNEGKVVRIEHVLVRKDRLSKEIQDQINVYIKA